MTETWALSANVDLLNGAPATGYARIEAVGVDELGATVVIPAIRDTTGNVIFTGPQRLKLIEGRLLTTLEDPVMLPDSTGHPDFSPAAWSYRVTLLLDHLQPAQYPVYVFALGSDLDLADVVSVPAITDPLDNPWQDAAEQTAADRAFVTALAASLGREQPGGIMGIGLDGRMADETRLPERLTEASLIEAYGRGVSLADPRFGAVGDGIADDSAAIRAALATGESVRVPHRHPVLGVPLAYGISEEGTTFGCLNLDDDAVLYGPGTLKLLTSTIRLIETSPGVFTPASVRPITVDTVADVKIHGITIDLGGFGVTGTHAVYANDSAGLQVEDVRVVDSGKGGIMLSGAMTKVRIRSCDIATAQNGITFYGSAGNPCAVDDVLIEGNRIETGVQPIDSEPTGGFAQNVRILGNRLICTAQNYALTMAGNGGGSEWNRRWLVRGNHLTGSISVTSCIDSEISGNIIDATGNAALNGIHGINYTRDLRIKGNHVYTAPDMAGIVSLYSASAGSGWLVEGNHLFIQGTGAGAIGVDMTSHGSCSVSGNMIHGANGAAGIRVRCTGAVVEAATVAGNVIDGFARGIWGQITGSANVERLVILGNTIDNSQGAPTVTAGIELTGTAAQYLQVIAAGNAVDPVYGANAHKWGSVLIRDGSSPARYSGNGSPEGVVTGLVGALYTRRDGTPGTCLYVKETGTGNTGWVEAVTGGARTATTAALAAIGNTVNTTGKRIGGSVWNSTTHKPVWAAGSAAGDVWYDATGAVAHTPV